MHDVITQYQAVQSGVKGAFLASSALTLLLSLHKIVHENSSYNLSVSSPHKWWTQTWKTQGI